MTIQQKPITQTPRRTFAKIFNFGMGRYEHFGSDMRGSIPAQSEAGRKETLVAPGRMSVPARRKAEGKREKPHE